MFALAVPGLAPLVRAELEEHDGLHPEDAGFDGRADVVLFGAGRGSRAEALALTTAEDVFVEVGRALRAHGDEPRWIAGRLWGAERMQRALSVWAELAGPLRARMTFRVIVRMLSERSFRRTELRRALTDEVGRRQPRWRIEDPAALELWAVEYRPGRFVAGLRASDVRMRQHQGRDAERTGALRPTVAAAMVRLAGEPRGRLLDPCCGSGTLLAEAQHRGWRGFGGDIDPTAIRVARRNVPNAQLVVADARAIPFQDGALAACVSNLPFGRQYGVEGPIKAWLHAVTAEVSRVVRPGGRVVLLSPERLADVQPGLRLLRRVPIRLLGTRTTIWAFERAGVSDQRD
jgi:23S rRNA G2445 N2-methylase RlmL